MKYCIIITHVTVSPIFILTGLGENALSPNVEAPGAIDILTCSELEHNY
jgi:hypothetical protein